MPPLASLRAFEAAARRLSFRAAAEELTVSQSAISHQVAELERRLGVQLFHRISRRVELTDAGALYQPYVREAFDRIATGTALVTRTGRTLDVQVYVTVAVRWLIPRLHSFTVAHPDVRVRLNTSTLDWEYDETACDVAIVCTDQPDRRSLTYTHLLDAMLTPVCSPALVAGTHPIRRPSDLAHHALLQLYTAEDEWSVWRRAAGLVEPVGDGGVRFDSYLLALEAAIDGQGVAIVPDFLAAPDLRTGRLVAPFDLAVPQPRSWYLVCRTASAEDVNVSRFRTWLRQEIGGPRSS
jgi:LysR family glycine cleavage system transcriptional activator